jgi:transcriptional regulator with XRE-family HTH domain
MDGQPPITPKQVKAARALLAWSQQDLAKQANLGVSTVADFERGHRTPVPNNAEAMRAALTKAGIAFLQGGAVIGPPLPSMTTSGESGTPLRLIDATDLAEWAERRDGQGTLPVLIERLIRAAVGPSARLRFPSDEGVQFSGWDGVAESHASDDGYVPDGKSGWEIGTQREGIAGKANDDYKKRTDKPGTIDPALSAFVFVTPRHWPAKDAWARERQSEGKWREVRAYDGDDLVHWIELYPAVGQWLAVSLRKRPAGALQLEEVWSEWSLATKWPLSTELVLSDRDEEATELLKWLRGQATTFSLQAETADEAASFFYAAIEQLPFEVASHYLSRCVVALTPEIARRLADSPEALIIVLLDPDPGLAQAMARRGHHVLLAYGGHPSLTGTTRKLQRPSREGIEVALEHMKVPRARNLARDASRSLAILRRLIPSEPGRLPDWAQQPPPHALLAAVLAGMWDETSDGDKTILARLSGLPYDEFIIALGPYVSNFDSPLRKVGTAWKVASPQDAWMLLAPYLTPVDLERFRTSAIDVLGELDPTFKLEPDQRWLAPIKGIKPEYSGFLRYGLGQVLILLALFGSQVSAASEAAHYAERIVRDLFTNADPQRWWSLSRYFQLLAEAAPNAFFEAVEESLDKNDPPIKALFGEGGDGIFATEHLSNILWALESLAWSPAYFARIAEILARLDAIDPGGRYSNRPAESLRHMFLLWAPQTNATFDQRIRVLDRLRKSHSNSAWKLMLSILPSGHDTFSPSPPTRWRDLTPDTAPEVVTVALFNHGAEELSKLLLEDVGTSAVRWKLLLDRLASLAPDRSAAIRKLAEVQPKITSTSDRKLIRDELRKILHHHRQFPEAGWAMPKAELDEIEKVYETFALADPIEDNAWLFSQAVSHPRPVEGWEGEQTHVTEERQRVAHALLTDHGSDGIFRLAELSEAAGYLGAALGDEEPATRDAILTRALKSDKDKDHDLAHGMIVKVFQTEGEAWTKALIARAASEHWGTEAILIVLIALPAVRWVWDEAKALGEEIESLYWKRVPRFWFGENDADLIYATNKFLEARRARHVVDLLGMHRGKDLPSALLVKVLFQIVDEVNKPGEENSDRVMFQHYVTEVLKKLDDAPDVDEQTMLNLEWAYLPLLEYSQRPIKVLKKALVEQPAFFDQILRAVFKPSEDSGIIEPPPDNPERAQAIAHQAYDLLRLANGVPGLQEDGTIDAKAMLDWVEKARELAKAGGREEIGDQKIGEILSASPQDKDGSWPAIPVREVIEAIRSKNLETGFMIGVTNRRGVTTRRYGEGGTLERTEAARYNGYADKTAVEWPHTSAVLRRIAESYEQDARRQDEDAERIDWR